jgi:hypothetical protein
MAGYRQFHTKFWKDEWLIELDPLERYLFVYLFTNELSSISGIYKIPLRVVQNETGLSREFIDKTLHKFHEAGKVFYVDGVMWVVNMSKYHANASPLTMKKVYADIELIPDCELKKACLHHLDGNKYPIDTPSIPYTYQVVKAKAKAKTETKTEEKEPSEHQEMFRELASVCQVDPDLQGSKIGKIAQILLKAKYTAEDVVSFGVWWTAEDFRGKQGQAPSLAQVVELIPRSKAGGNNKKPSEKQSPIVQAFLHGESSGTDNA